MRGKHPSPQCPNCGRIMQLMRVVSEPNGSRDVLSFECRECHVTYLEAAEKLDSARD